MTKRWVQVPRNKEGPEPVYLAKVPDRPRKRGDVEVVEVVETMVATVRRRVPPPKRKAKPRGRKPGPKKTVSFAEERLRTFPVVVPHNSDPNAPGGPTPGGVPIGGVVEAAAGDTEMVDVDAGTKEEEVPVGEVAKEVEKREVEEEKTAIAELPKKPVVAERKAHPLPPRPAGLPPKPVGAANLVSGENAVVDGESKTPGRQ